MANKAIKYRLYPTTEQKTMFAKTFGCCRKVYNLMLNDKIESYKKTGRFASVTPAMYKKEYPFLKEADSLALANVQLNLQGAFRSCFDKSRKRQNGFPKFKSAKHSRKAYTTNNQKGTVAIIGNAVKLPKIGKVKAVIHRQPDADWIIRSATVSQDGDGKYYVSVLLNLQEILRLFRYLITLSVLIMPLTVCMLTVMAIQAPTINIIVKAIKNLQKSSAGFPV